MIYFTHGYNNHITGNELYEQNKIKGILLSRLHNIGSNMDNVIEKYKDIPTFFETPLYVSGLINFNNKELEEEFSKRKLNQNNIIDYTKIIDYLDDISKYQESVIKAWKSHLDDHKGISKLHNKLYSVLSLPPADELFMKSVNYLSANIQMDKYDAVSFSIKISQISNGLDSIFKLVNEWLNKLSGKYIIFTIQSGSTYDTLSDVDAETLRNGILKYFKDKKVIFHHGNAIAPQLGNITSLSIGQWNQTKSLTSNMLPFVLPESKHARKINSFFNNEYLLDLKLEKFQTIKELTGAQGRGDAIGFDNIWNTFLANTNDVDKITKKMIFNDIVEYSKIQNSTYANNMKKANKGLKFLSTIKAGEKKDIIYRISPAGY